MNQKSRHKPATSSSQIDERFLDLGKRKEQAGHELCQVVDEIAEQRWCQGTGGNFSVVIQEKPLELLITQSGKKKRGLTISDLVVVDKKAQPVVGDSGKPSAETLIHCKIAQLTTAKSILHTHSVWNTLLGEHFRNDGGFTMNGYEMLEGLTGTTTYEKGVFVPILPNSQDTKSLSRKVSSTIKKYPKCVGFLLAGHGLYTWGNSLDDAHRHVEIFEFLFECIGRRTKF